MKVKQNFQVGPKNCEVHAVVHPKGRNKFDIDDGVKVNCGKFGDLLDSVKVVAGGAGDE